MLAAEERASQISPKLTVVMILFILPTLMVVLVGPAIINIGRNLWPTLQGNAWRALWIALLMVGCAGQRTKAGVDPTPSGHQVRSRRGQD